MAFDFESMKTIKFIINNDHGLHARPAGQLVQVASEFSSTITMKKEGNSASAKGLFALMGLGIKPGEAITIEIEGKDEELAYDAIKNFLEVNLA